MKYLSEQTRSLVRCGIVLALLIVFVVPTQVQAQIDEVLQATLSASPSIPETPINLTISPISLNFETDPGVSQKSEIKLRNNSTQPEHLALSIGTFTADSDGEKPMLLDPQPGDPSMEWLHFDQTPFILNPGEMKTIPVEFAPPAEAALSYYYTIIINRTGNPNVSDGTAVKGAPAVLVLASVHSPNARRELQVESFKVVQPFSEYLPSEFEVAIKNTGNVYLSPAGNIFIDGQRQKDLAVLSLNPANSQILPQTTRVFKVGWSDGFPVFVPKIEDDKQVFNDEGVPEQTLKWDFSKADQFRLGKYTAHLLLAYDNGERDVPIESFVGFWVIPWKLLLLGGGVVALALFGLFSVVKAIYRIFKKNRKPELRQE